MSIIIDSYSEANQDNDQWFGAIAGGANTQMGQSFTGDGHSIESVKLYLKNTGGSSGTATINIYAHTGTFGTSSKPTGPALSTGTLDVATVGASFALYTISMSPYTTVNGTNYCVIMEYVDNRSNSTSISYDSSSPSHGGNRITNSSTDVYIPVSNSDVIFYVYGSGGRNDASSRALASNRSLASSRSLASNRNNV